MSYHNSIRLHSTFPEAIEKVKAALAEEGFGVISEIDLKAKFREKLNEDFQNYTILGACNPKLAFQAIANESNIGVLLLCNVLVQESDDENITVSAVNPMETMAAVNNPALNDIAAEVSQRLEKVISTLSKQ